MLHNPWFSRPFPPPSVGCPLIPTACSRLGGSLPPYIETAEALAEWNTAVFGSPGMDSPTEEGSVVLDWLGQVQVGSGLCLEQQ